MAETSGTGVDRFQRKETARDNTAAATPLREDAPMPAAAMRRAVAEGAGAPVDLSNPRPARSISRLSDLPFYREARCIPWRRDDLGRVVWAACDPAEAHARLEARGEAHPVIVSTTPHALSAALQRRFRDSVVLRAVNQLKSNTPLRSAHETLTQVQGWVLIALALAVVASFALSWRGTLIALNAVCTSYFLAALFFKLALVIAGRDGPRPAEAGEMSGDDEQAKAPEETWPVISILLPLYREPNMLLPLAQAIGKLDYPADRLDVKLVLEADDQETREALSTLPANHPFDVIISPHSGPRTKPKALNYALGFARGEFVAVYDAEDRPDPGQLKEAVLAFRAGGDRLGCVQARLDFYNADENWLTRQFAIEYALLFEFYLPGLERLGLPIPLSGTSNIVRRAALDEVGGWDPFNVTEDADLGLRLARAGYRTRTIRSVTYEEAVCKPGPWLRQRSRWIKGHLQTFLVLTREPRSVVRALGLKGAIAATLFVGGNVLNAAINPVFWAVFAVWLITGAAGLAAFFPGALLPMSLFALLVGNFVFVYLAMIAPFQRGRPDFGALALTTPAYWLLASLAGYRALSQIIRRPSYWEKTAHGVSSHPGAYSARTPRIAPK